MITYAIGFVVFPFAAWLAIFCAASSADIVFRAHFLRVAKLLSVVLVSAARLIIVAALFARLGCGIAKRSERIFAFAVFAAWLPRLAAVCALVVYSAHRVRGAWALAVFAANVSRIAALLASVALRIAHVRRIDAILALDAARFAIGSTLDASIVLCGALELISNAATTVAAWIASVQPASLAHVVFCAHFLTIAKLRRITGVNAAWLIFVATLLAFVGASVAK